MIIYDSSTCQQLLIQEVVRTNCVVLSESGMNDDSSGDVDFHLKLAFVSSGELCPTDHAELCNDFDGFFAAVSR